METYAPPELSEPAMTRTLPFAMIVLSLLVYPVGAKDGFEIFYDWSLKNGKAALGRPRIISCSQARLAWQMRDMNNPAGLSPPNNHHQQHHDKHLFLNFNYLPSYLSI